MSQSENNLIWVDLEMTGLDTDNDFIIEIATIVTDPQLTILEEGPVIAIHQPDAILNGMDEWNIKQHGQSGLMERVKNSQFSEADAEKQTIEFLEKYVPAGKSPMCGNSICQDRRFMYRIMPSLESYFHYRNMDVSSVKEMLRRWAPDKFTYVKKATHLAIDDIRDSIEELKFYRKNFFNC